MDARQRARHLIEDYDAGLRIDSLAEWIANCIDVLHELAYGPETKPNDKQENEHGR